jgi:hypothetical protein
MAGVVRGVLETVANRTGSFVNSAVTTSGLPVAQASLNRAN